MINYNEQELLKKYREGNCNEEELRWIEAWYGNWNRKERVDVSEADLNRAEAVMRENVLRRTKPRIKTLGPLIAVAASIIIVLGTLAVLLNLVHDPDAKDRDTLFGFSKTNNIAPGKNRATLTLANGKVIMLSNTKTGVVIDAGKLTYNDGSEVEVGGSSKTEPLTSAEEVLTSIEIPRGGTYQVILPDGTRVWLNAASSLRFPPKFARNERRVELTGEAYFVVKHNALWPFRVQTARQYVEDIGTAFNIMAYTDEHAVKTTLIEGSARVVMLGQLKDKEKGARRPAQYENGVILKPSQQSSLANTGNIKVIQVDPENAIAWKNNEFMFNNEELGSIMKKLARWYDIEIQYEDNNIAKERFWGAISRFENVSDVLNMLELTKKAHFKIEGRRVIVKR